MKKGAILGISRRELLGGGAMVAVSRPYYALAQPETNLAKTQNLKVTLTVEGKTYNYPMGPALPSYFVGFRSDGRVVFHLGALGELSGAASTAKPFELGPHHVKIESEAAVLFDQEISSHWWNSEWTYRTAPVTVRTAPAQLVAAKRMFPFGDTGCRVNAVADYNFKGPMDSAGITKYMPTTGERPDIGWVTDPSGYFMLTGKSGPMVAWALAAGSCPHHFRDETTSKPIDLLKYPKTNAYDLPARQGAPWLPKGLPDLRAPAYTVYGGGWTPQQAHFCEMSYVAYMATGDLGFLEDLQYNANFTILCDASRSTPAAAIVSGETRGIAWALRNLFMAHIATSDAERRDHLPNTCHSSKYWKTLLDQSLEFFAKVSNNPSNQVFRLIAENDRFSPWTCDYLSTALAFGVLTGHSDWAPFYLWVLGNQIARTSGKHGFPPGIGVPYRLSTAPGWSWKQAFDALVGDAEIKLSQAQHDSLVENPLNGGRAMMGSEYLMTTRAALVMAAYLDNAGLARVRSEYPDLDACLANTDRMARAYGSVNARVSVIVQK